MNIREAAFGAINPFAVKPGIIVRDATGEEILLVSGKPCVYNAGRDDIYNFSLEDLIATDWFWYFGGKADDSDYHPLCTDDIWVTENVGTVIKTDPPGSQ